MKRENLKKGMNVVYIVFGILLLLLALGSLVLQIYLDAILTFFWGALFIFLGLKEWLESKLSSKSLKIAHYILLGIIVAVSYAKFIYRLKVL